MEAFWTCSHSTNWHLLWLFNSRIPHLPVDVVLSYLDISFCFHTMQNWKIIKSKWSFNLETGTGETCVQASTAINDAMKRKQEISKLYLLLRLSSLDMGKNCAIMRWAFPHHSLCTYSPRNRVKVGGGVEKETGRRRCYLLVELLLRWWWKSRRSIWEDGLNWEGNLLEAGGVESGCAGYQVLLLLLAADLGCTRWCRPGTVQLEPRV